MLACLSSGEDVKINVDQNSSQVAQDKPFPNKRLFQKWKSFPAGHTYDDDKGSVKSRRWSRTPSGDILQIADKPLPKLAEDEEIVGIITMEDVIEELLQVSISGPNFILALFLVHHHFHGWVNIFWARNLWLRCCIQGFFIMQNHSGLAHGFLHLMLRTNCQGSIKEYNKMVQFGYITAAA